MDMNWMRPAAQGPLSRVFNSTQAAKLVKAHKCEPHLIEMTARSHDDETMNWTWTSNFIRSRTWTVHKGWNKPEWSDDYAAIVLTASHKGRTYEMRIHSMAWEWFAGVTQSDYTL